MPTFRAISQTVNMASPSMVSFIFETTCLRDSDLADFGAFLGSDIFSSALLCHKTHKKVHRQ